MTRSFRLTVAGALGVALLAVACLVPAVTSAAADGDITFKNQTRKTQYILVRAGDGEACSDKMEKTHLELEPGESSDVSADERVCWCYSGYGKIGDCTNWKKAKPGSLQRIR